MEISEWNKIMSSFQDLMGWEKGMTEVIITKRIAFGNTNIEEINGRDLKTLVHILRKRYREILYVKSRKSKTKN